MTRKTFWRALKLLLSLLLLAGAGYGSYYFYRAVNIATAYTAKILCSGVYVSQRPEAAVIEEDLEWFPFLTHAVDRPSGTTASSLFGGFRTQALYRPGLGCTLLVGVTREDLLRQVDGYTPPVASRRDEELPRNIIDEVQYVVDREVFRAGERSPRTRALIVLRGGRVAAEAYAEGFGPETPLAGWSMAKSVTNALTGILVGEGSLSLEQPAPVPEWPPGDPRAVIRIEHLLRMTGGLYFREFYFGPSTATQMLFRSYSTARLAASQPVEDEPGTVWHYSSGATNIISRILRHRLEGSQADYFAFPHRALFGPVEMYSAVFEPDPSGTFVGSSFLYATARDWARFGQLYLQDGVWRGRRILPSGWVSYSTQVTPQSPRGRYGAHWWLNRGDPPDSPNRVWPRLPSDTFFASGFEGQYVLVAPSRQAVIVRLGLSHPPAYFDIGEFARQVLERLPQEGNASRYTSSKRSARRMSRPSLR